MSDSTSSSCWCGWQISPAKWQSKVHLPLRAAKTRVLFLEIPAGSGVPEAKDCQPPALRAPAATCH